MAITLLCSLLEFPSKEVWLSERGHGQSLGFSAVPGMVPLLQRKQAETRACRGLFCFIPAAIVPSKK